MTASVILSLYLPMALGVIMLGLGLSLTLADFRRVLEYPKAVGVALGCQMLLLPLVCAGVAHFYGLSPVLAVGLMLLAASPGGTSANLYSHLAHGDVALNVTLTAINSVLAIITLPLVVNLSLTHFFGEGKVLPLQFDKVVQVFTIVLGPVAAGMWVRYQFPAFAARMEKPVKIASAIFLFSVVILVMVTQFTALSAGALQVGLAALTFNLLSLLVGYFVPLMVRLSQRQATAIGMEIGIHNGTLSIAIAMSPTLLNSPEMAIPAAIYGMFAFITAAIFGMLVSKRTRRETAAMVKPAG